MKNLNLVNARKQKNLTQKQLAESLIGVSKASVSNWENGYSKPRLETALQVSVVLGKDVSFLFGYEVQESCTKQLA